MKQFKIKPPAGILQNFTDFGLDPETPNMEMQSGKQLYAIHETVSQ
jgi:hypothetical protein